MARCDAKATPTIQMKSNEVRFKNEHQMMYIYNIYIHMRYYSICLISMYGGQNYLLLVMDMAKVGGPLSIVKVSTQIRTSRVHFLLLYSL